MLCGVSGRVGVREAGIPGCAWGRGGNSRSVSPQIRAFSLAVLLANTFEKAAPVVPPVGFEPTHTAPEAASAHSRSVAPTRADANLPVGHRGSVPRIFRIMKVAPLRQHARTVLQLGKVHRQFLAEPARRVPMRTCWPSPVSIPSRNASMGIRSKVRRSGSPRSRAKTIMGGYG